MEGEHWAPATALDTDKEIPLADLRVALEMAEWMALRFPLCVDPETEEAMLCAQVHDYARSLQRELAGYVRWQCEEVEK